MSLGVAPVLADVNWWCASSRQVWDWSKPQPYVGAWAIVVAVLALSLWWALRGSKQDPLVAARAQAAAPADPRRATASAERAVDEAAPARSSRASRTTALLFGVVGLWACLDWPLASLGAGYLATAQMARQVLMVMAVAPLLLFACPDELAARLVGWGKRLTVLRWAARPRFAVPFAALTLVAVNAPVVVDAMVKTPYGAFVIDLAWIFAGFVLWMPVQCPHPGVRRLTGASAMVYLILQSIVPLLPGFFMTWADYPLYATYELAPRVFDGFDAVTDQQTAAAVLQVGGMVFLWVQIAFRFLRWGYQQLALDQANAKPIAGAPPTAA